MRYLVTGGAGFIGSHLVDRLLERGDRVVVLDDLSTGRLDNLRAHRGREELRCRIGSVEDLPLLRRLVAECDLVFHLAAVVGVRLVLEQPLVAIRSIVRGTEAVLETAAGRGVPVVLASSSEVYGDSTPVPFREDHEVRLGPTTQPRGAYACAKALSEWSAHAHAAQSGVDTLVVRLFNTVGPRQRGRFGMVLPRFCAQAVRGEPLTVYGDGRQTRCFAHVRDVIEALLALVARADRAFGSVFNVGADREVSIFELAALCRDLAGTRSPIVRVPFDQVYAPGAADIRRRVPDLSRLAEVTGFRPATSLEQIVEDVLAEQRELSCVAAAGSAVRP